MTHKRSRKLIEYHVGASENVDNEILSIPYEKNISLWAHAAHVKWMLMKIWSITVAANKCLVLGGRWVMGPRPLFKWTFNSGMNAIQPLHAL